MLLLKCNLCNIQHMLWTIMPNDKIHITKKIYLAVLTLTQVEEAVSFSKLTK